MAEENAKIELPNGGEEPVMEKVENVEGGDMHKVEESVAIGELNEHGLAKSELSGGKKKHRKSHKTGGKKGGRKSRKNHKSSRRNRRKGGNRKSAKSH